MADLATTIRQLIDQCLLLPNQEQAHFIDEQLSGLLYSITLNPTGDDPENIDKDAGIKVILSGESNTANIKSELSRFTFRYAMLKASAQPLTSEVRQVLEREIKTLAEKFLHASLVEKFKIPENRVFLDKGLQNSECPWQIAMVANWVLSKKGIKELSDGVWSINFPDLEIQTLIQELEKRIRFTHIPTLRTYRRDAMRHYPRLTEDELTKLESDQWQDIIDFPSGRAANMDIPFITPVIKQGDIEHSLYRHFLMPDLLIFMRKATSETSKSLKLTGKDRNILLSLPIVIQQTQEELFSHVKSTITQQISSWASSLQADVRNEASTALAIAGKIWNYKRTPAAKECLSPVDNLTKGFTATIRNAFGHFTDINFAASHGAYLDPFDVAEKFVLFASVSNGQLAAAHQQYIATLPNPADWDNEKFFQYFLAVNREMDPHHIQAHFIVDKTRGCPAVPQIARFHAIVLDLVLNYVLKEFGESTLRDAGNWYINEKTPSNTGP